MIEDVQELDQDRMAVLSLKPRFAEAILRGTRIDAAPASSSKGLEIATLMPLSRAIWTASFSRGCRVGASTSNTHQYSVMPVD